MKPIAAGTIITIFVGSSLFAENWAPLKGAEIAEVLTDQTYQYEGAVQSFYASGQTLYTADRESWGRWRIEADQYCSVWPPASGWVCDDVAKDLDGDRIKFVGSSGFETIGWPAL